MAAKLADNAEVSLGGHFLVTHSTSIRLSEKMEYLYNYCIGILCHLDSKSDVGKPSVTFTADSPK